MEFDLDSKFLVSAFVDAGTLAGDQEFRRSITRTFVDYELFPIPLPSEAELGGGLPLPIVGIFRGQGSAPVQVQLLPNRFDYLVLPQSPEAKIDFGKLIEDASRVLATALDTSGRKAHRLAVVHEAMATTLVDQQAAIEQAKDALINIPEGWSEPITEWNWRVLSRCERDNESINEIVSVRRFTGTIRDRQIEALACEWDVNTVPEAVHPRFGAADLGIWLPILREMNDSLAKRTQTVVEAQAGK